MWRSNLEFSLHINFFSHFSKKWAVLRNYTKGFKNPSPLIILQITSIWKAQASPKCNVSNDLTLRQHSLTSLNSSPHLLIIWSDKCREALRDFSIWSFGLQSNHFPLSFQPIIYHTQEFYFDAILLGVFYLLLTAIFPDTIGACFGHTDFTF